MHLQTSTSQNPQRDKQYNKRETIYNDTRNYFNKTRDKEDRIRKLYNNATSSIDNNNDKASIYSLIKAPIINPTLIVRETLRSQGLKINI